MALNIQTFKTRALTALLFVVVMLTGLLWNFWSFLILFTVIHFGCWYEFVKLMKKIYAEKYLGYCLFGLIYLTMPVLMIIDLYNPANHIHIYDTFIVLVKGTIPIVIIASIWINDTMAYLVGSFIGKTPLSKISPKKTWEGTIGGIVLCITVAGLVSHFIFHSWIVNLFIMLLAAICAIFGTLGDLLESKIKRMADVKDSGSFMPGHGGFLDRFDSLLVAVPFVWLYIKLFV
ncbi:MAG: phosphatidate cytidylyltransferase [Chitinophagaceae bacterium]|nr:phosphatidate cytidylyltransferase [Chitinophagaceae bacterium]MBL0198782.1 phosphatidate cytidylyltransferase [Chitinophagaceae bacterium]